MIGPSRKTIHFLHLTLVPDFNRSSTRLHQTRRFLPQHLLLRLQALFNPSLAISQPGRRVQRVTSALPPDPLLKAQPVCHPTVARPRLFLHRVADHLYRGVVMASLSFRLMSARKLCSPAPKSLRLSNRAVISSLSASTKSGKRRDSMIDIHPVALNR